MFEFQQYNSANPQIITSFKGNQKLILGGYRYNIHHVKEGVKTWRCVCAKKLTGARSWCKGRAETWDGDTKGIPKGEHNHQTEHELAEQEYFKSQLIFAAISDPQADLNTLMDEASRFLSPGLNFGNRESLKKSLIVARKSAESGELTLGQPPHRNNTLKGTGIKKTAVRPKGGGGTGMPSATLRAAPNTAGKANANKNNPSMNPSIPSSSTKSIASSKNKKQQSPPSFGASSSSFLNSSAGSSTSSGFGSSFGSSTLTDFIDSSPLNQQQNWSSNQQLLEMSGMAGFLEATNSGIGDLSGGAVGNGSQFCNANVGGVATSNDQLLAAALLAAAMLGNAAQQQQNQQMPTLAEMPTTTVPNKKTSTAGQSNNKMASFSNSGGRNASTPVVAQQQNMLNNMKKRKSARVNGILQKLSSKVAAGSSGSPSPPPLLDQNQIQIKEEAKMEKEDEEIFEPKSKKLMVNSETQTDESTFQGEEEMREERKRKLPTGGFVDGIGGTTGNNIGFGTKQQENNGHCCHRKIICCCYANEEELVENNLPNGCQKRARLMSIKSNGSSNEPNNNNNSKIDDRKSATLENGDDDDEMEEGEINEKDEEEEKSTTKNEEPADEGIANLGLFELGRELKLEIADENEEDGEDWEKIGTAE